MRISRGIIFMFTATGLLSLMQVCVKSLPHIPVYEIIFFRGVTSCLASYIALYKKNISLRGKDTFLLLRRGVVGTASLLTFFYSIQNIPLATAVGITHLSPIFLGFLAVFFLKEKFSPVQWVSLGICIAGVFLIKGFDYRITGWELTIAILSAFLAAFAHFHIRLLKDEIPEIVLFYFSLVMMLMTLPLILYKWKTPDTIEWILILITGLISHLAQYFLTRAFQLEEVSRVAWGYYFGIIIALLIGLFFYDEKFNFYTYCGMTFVCLGIALNLFYKKN